MASTLSSRLDTESPTRGGAVAAPPASRRSAAPAHRFGGAALALGRLLFALAGLALPILGAELFFRYSGALPPGEYQTADLSVASELYGRQNLANRAGLKKSSEFTTHVRLNSNGLRGPEIPYAKAPDTFRVLVVGDSFTFGAQVDEDETFVARLGEHLARGAPQAGMDGARIETINAGVDGWSTINALAWLRTEGVKYAPDLVILMFYTGNDPGENFDRMKAVKRLTGSDETTSALPAAELRRWLAGESRLYAVVESGVIAKLQPAPAPDEVPDPSLLKVRRSADSDRKERGWELSATLLRQVREHCDLHGTGFLTVGIPTVEHVVNDDRPPTPFAEMSREAGAAAVDLLDLFRLASGSSSEPLYYPKDKHWTARGHELAATHVAELLVQQGYLHEPRLPARSLDSSARTTP